MKKITVKPKGREKVFNCDNQRVITGETEVLETRSIRKSIKKGELEIVSKAKKISQKPKIKDK